MYARSAGIVSILTHQGDPAGPWSIREIDRVPTSHRLRFADLDGSGRKVLVNFPLMGARAGITGVFDMTIGTHEEPLGPGSGVIVPANVAHSIANKRGGVMTVIEFHTVRRPDLAI